jgi:hypothetical protein
VVGPLLHLPLHAIGQILTVLQAHPFKAAFPDLGNRAYKPIGFNNMRLHNGHHRRGIQCLGPQKRYDLFHFSTSAVVNASRLSPPVLQQAPDFLAAKIFEDKPTKHRRVTRPMSAVLKPPGGSCAKPDYRKVQGQ